MWYKNYFQVDITSPKIFPSKSFDFESKRATSCRHLEHSISILLLTVPLVCIWKGKEFISVTNSCSFKQLIKKITNPECDICQCFPWRSYYYSNRMWLSLLHGFFSQNVCHMVISLTAIYSVVKQYVVSFYQT